MSRPSRNLGEGDVTETRVATGVRVFTLGYQGRSLPEVLDIVRTEGIEEVLDVRENASSRKQGFDATSLKGELSKIGVRYAHLPELGCEHASRHALWRGGPREPFLVAYRQRLEDHPRAFADLVARIMGSRSLLLCMERDASRCHRAVLGERLRKGGFTVEDL